MHSQNPSDDAKIAKEKTHRTYRVKRTNTKVRKRDGNIQDQESEYKIKKSGMKKTVRAAVELTANDLLITDLSYCRLTSAKS